MRVVELQSVTLKLSRSRFLSGHQSWFPVLCWLFSCFLSGQSISHAQIEMLEVSQWSSIMVSNCHQFFDVLSGCQLLQGATGHGILFFLVGLVKSMNSFLMAAIQSVAERVAETSQSLNNNDAGRMRLGN